MGKRYLIDTNVLIDFQQGKLNEKSRIFVADILDEDFTVSFITYIEYLGFDEIPPSAEAFIKLANVLTLDEEIIETCIILRKQKHIKLPDAIIAATALSRNLTILTRNSSDFKGINYLETVNPWEMG